MVTPSQQAFRHRPPAFLVMAVWLFFCTHGQAAELRLELDKTQSEMGKYFVAKLIYRGDSDPGPVDLSLWQDDFFIEQFDVDLSPIAQGQIQTDTTLRLYPRHSGDITLDAIALGGSIVKPQHLMVLPSIRNGIDATPVVQPLQSFYWADQAIVISIDVRLHDERNNVVADDWVLPGFTVQPLKPQRLQSAEGDSIRLTWMLLTPQKGLYDIELPAIEQRGRGRFRYHLRAIHLTIKPLPAYLPATIPVGPLSVQSELIESIQQQWLWQMRLENPGRLPAQPEGLQTLLERLNIEETELTVEDAFDSASGISSRVYRIPLPQWYFGAAQPVKLAFFNPASGRLETLQHQLAGRVQLPRPVVWAGILLLVPLLFYLAYGLDSLAARIRRWRQFRQSISRSQNAQQLRQLILQENCDKTLTEWAAHNAGDRPGQIAAGLNALCFNEHVSDNIDELKQYCLDYFSYANYSAGARASNGFTEHHAESGH